MKILLVLLCALSLPTSYNKKLMKNGKCVNWPFQESNLDSQKIYPNLDFKASWALYHKFFWKSTDFDFEARFFKETKNGTWKSHNSSLMSPLPHVKVFLLPFSHNDPGWKETYEVYFYTLTKKILSNAINKLSEYKSMTFAWSEVSFLSKWWDEASYSQKETLRRLVKEGRFEILTGGWVMPDEATSTVFALVNLLVEGNQWIKQHLNISPKSAWSLDAFGHGSTMPYLLKKTGIQGMMIQRVHYAWKHWFAEHREGDFLWMPRWSSNQEDGIVCHNAHYDLYPTKHSCGPSPNICMKFDFRILEGFKDEHIAHVQEVKDRNIGTLSDALTGQYRRTASLTKHNTVISTLGGDFRFENALEWEQQYTNYKLLFDFINSRKSSYHTSVKFGTLTDYFTTIRESNSTLSVFNGDFFPYAYINIKLTLHFCDVIFPFSPAYWTGYFGTRPFFKKLSRQSEDELYKAEILFTFSYNLLRQHNYSTEVISRNYDNLVYARRFIALFQHHDGITGTSPRSTMLDYSRKLTKAWNFCRQIQRLAIEHIWRKYLAIPVPPLITNTVRNSYTKPSRQITVKLYENVNIIKKLVLFNSLAWKRSHLVRLRVEVAGVTVRGPHGESVLAQVNIVPIPRTGIITQQFYELLFIAELPPLSVATYSIFRLNAFAEDNSDAAVHGTISCKTCNDDASNQITIRNSEISLDNGRITAYFNSEHGILTRVEDRNQLNLMRANVTLSFGRYDALYGSGAYLLRPYVSTPHPIINSEDAILYLTRGPITSEILLITPQLNIKSWILHSGSVESMSCVYISIEVNGTATLGSFGEYFMRFQTDLNNTESTFLHHNPYSTDKSKPSPILFTDTNGLSVEKRTTLHKLPYQANHFPITYFTFIQDPIKNLRLSLLVDRSHGVSSLTQGRIETIFNRHLQYDDARGMNEGVMDLEDFTSNYIIKLERIPPPPPQHHPHTFDQTWEPSLAVQKLSKILNHQPTLFVYDALATHKDGNISLFSHPFPDDVHLLNLQTLSNSSENSEDIKSIPSTKALMILQRLGHNSHPFSTISKKECNHNQRNVDNVTKLNSTIQINHSVKRTNLVGTKPVNDNDNDDADDANVSTQSRTMKHLPVGRHHELSAFLINF